MRKKLLSALLAATCALSVNAQSLEAYPSHWFTKMQWNKIQVIVRSKTEQLSGKKVSVNYPGVKLTGVDSFSNKRYLALQLTIGSSTNAGIIPIQFFSADDTLTLQYVIKPSRSGRGTQYAQGVRSADLIYLLMPDRFSNGDPTNDAFNNMQDVVANRSNPLNRHGGDIPGVIRQLDYLKDLGVTTVWMTPVNENDMPLEKESAGMLSGYHGYWFTNQYQIDPRFGGNEAYKKLVETAHQKGMKIIQDAVYNHVGIEHWMYKDAPGPDWINRWPGYTGSNHKEEVLFDPYASEKDKKQLLDGWFVPHLPDVNQRNPYVANYLIQYAIWATEEFGIDGWRVDTYKYCDEPFLNRINTALLKEYPSLTMFGEAWTNSVSGNAYFTRNQMEVPFKHNMLGGVDFPMNGAILEAINQPEGWTQGINRLHMTQAQDFLYEQPLNNCLFLDNHDTDRFFSMVGEDFNKFKQGIGLLLTLRGIPQLYYGTEILMKNFKNPSDAMVRLDFPGGFAGDALNKFTANGRTALENEAFNYVRQLAGYRKKSLPLQIGKTKQFLPVNGVYVFTRTHQKQSVLCVLNRSNETREIPFKSYEESFAGFTKAVDVLTGEVVSQSLKVGAGQFKIFELKAK
ncbi:MAG: alpha-amylase family glycosyl hydrolase [Chitinophagia bacterium]